VADEPPFITRHGPDSDEYQSTLAQDLQDAIDECRDYGIDPVPIMVGELRRMGYVVMKRAEPEGPEHDF
jgi:hypothetical protein